MALLSLLLSCSWTTLAQGRDFSAGGLAVRPAPMMAGATPVLTRALGGSLILVRGIRLCCLTW